jgi:hypothetical protein
MAQTKRKRRTKHRGNAAGVVEVRGRTGRKPTTSEKGGKSDARARRLERLDRPPTWRSAAQRALVATAIMLALSVLVLRFNVTRTVALMPVVLLIYIPMGYYTDLFLYRRRQRQKVASRG